MTRLPGASKFSNPILALESIGAGEMAAVAAAARVLRDEKDNGAAVDLLGEAVRGAAPSGVLKLRLKPASVTLPMTRRVARMVRASCDEFEVFIGAVNGSVWYSANSVGVDARGAGMPHYIFAM